jgi:ATP-dependent DNA helicase DinG
MNLTSAIDQAFDSASKNMPGFRPRASQLTMAHAIKEVLCSEEGSRIAVIEGQTGTGKTLGYLLSAIPAAQSRGLKLVIATATVSLQSQLVDRDLPAVQKYTGLEFRYVIAKGRGRYACPVKLIDFLGRDPNQASLGFGLDEPDVDTANEGELKIIERLDSALQSNAWNGCRDSLTEDVPDDLWKRLTSTSGSCGAKRCPSQRSCPFYLARWAMRDTDVIVANHDLVLSDLAMGGGVILPKPDETIYVFDEGHHLAEKAVERAASRGTIAALNIELRRIPKVIGTNPTGDRPDVGPAMQALKADLQAFQSNLFSLDFETVWGGKEIYRAPGGQLPVAIQDQCRILSGRITDVWRSVDLVHSRLIQAADNNPDIAVSKLPEAGLLAEKLYEYSLLFELMGAEVNPNHPPTARWIEKLDNRNFFFEAVPVTSAPWLERQLWKRAAGAVVTSATLTSLSQWSRFRARNGLKEGDGTLYLRLTSPFNYAENAELSIPWMNSEAGNVAAHTREIIQVMPDLLEFSSAGTLCLFSSWKQLKEVFDAMPVSIQRRTICQGDYTRDETLARHAAEINAGKPSVLFGVASMAEGLDLPGKLCDHVIIAKLPFAPPDSPVDATRAEWLESLGHNPFVLMSVPDASFKLIQACGRLIRTESDKGRVTLLDRRVITKRYGKQLLDALPPFKRIIGQRSKAA